MYVGNKHTSTITIAEIVDFQCIHCSHKSKAEVVGVGQGQGNSAYFMDESGAKGRAQTGAELNASKNVQETLKLAKCPKCYKRNTKNVRIFWAKQILKLVGSAGFILLIGAFIYGLKKDEVVFFIFGGCAGLLVIIMYFIDVKWRWFTVDNRVRFIKGERF